MNFSHRLAFRHVWISAAAIATSLLVISCADDDNGGNGGATEQSRSAGGMVEGALGAERDSSGGDVASGGHTNGQRANGPTEEQPQGEHAMALDIFERLNAERVARGLEALEWNEDLAGIAMEWNEVMADTEVFEHRELNRELIETRLEGMMGVGENIFSATAPVPSGQAHLGWMKSEGHRANLLSPNWDLVGVGVHCAPDGRVYATQNFGRTIQPGPTEQTNQSPPEDPITRDDPEGPSC